jgi:hypothetical protein
MRVRGLVLVALVVVSAAPLDASRGQEPPAPLPGCVERGPCVYVTPDPRTVQTVGMTYTFDGQRWAPGPVRVTFSEFCPPDVTCDNGSEELSVVADAQGRFTLALRYEPGVGDPRDASFEQGRGMSIVRRDAFPPPPPSTPEQRAEAAGIAAAIRTAKRRLDRVAVRARLAERRAFRRLERCKPQNIELRISSRKAEVLGVLGRLPLDRVTFAIEGPALRAFAADLARLDLEDPELRAAADAWRRHIASPNRWSERRACEAMRRWARTGYRWSARPVDADADVIERNELFAAIDADPAIAAGAARLRALGAGQRRALQFAGALLTHEPLPLNEG